MARLELFLMGPPLVSLDAVPLRLETRKTVALLVFLSRNRGSRSRESLATLFWPEYNQERASANLRRTLASLRADIGDELLHADRDTVELGRDLDVDLEKLARCVEEVQSHGHDAVEHCPDCRERLEKAAGLYRGEFLEGFNLKDCPEFDRWQLLERDAARQEASTILELLTRAYCGADRWPEAADTARRWLSLDELHEPAHRALMAAYAASGNRAAALRQFTVCRELLLRELGQEPEPETFSVYAEIRERKPGSRGSPAAPGYSNTAEAPGSGKAVPETPVQDSIPPTAAAAGIVTTKLRHPQVRASCVERSRLFTLLDSGAKLPLTLVSAPAGFGKTTLLAAWAAGSPHPVAWISLDEGDNDPIRFLSYLASSLSTFAPGLGAETVKMFRTPQIPPARFVLGSIINELDRVPGERILVLDDYHLITGAEIHDCISFLIEHLPAHAHLVIATRIDPLLPLARFRGRGKITEIRADELRFTRRETEEFLRSFMSIDVSDEEIGILDRRTEGWAAGLQMAGLSLQNRTDHAQFIRTFGGSNRYIMDYLMEEVLSRQPEELQEFLLTTAVLDRFCANLCDHMRSARDSQALLERLEASNLFLTPLDDERRWYRYHHLFADLLRYRLSARHTPGQVNELHRQAGIWFEKDGDLDGAVHHYFSGHHIQEVMELLEHRFKDMITLGRLRTLIGWVERIPEELVRPRPGLCFALGWTYAWAGKRQEAEHYLDYVDKNLLGDAVDDESAVPETDRARALLGSSFTMRAFILDMAGETEQAVRLVHRADPLLPGEDGFTRPILPYILGKAHRYAGDLQPAERYTREFLGMARLTGLPWPVSGAVHELAWIYRLQGCLRKADELFEDFEELIRGYRYLGPVAKVIAHHAELCREHGQIERARALLEKALPEVERWGLPSDMLFCYLTGIRFHLSTGDIGAAARDLGAAETVARNRLVYASMLPLLEAERVRVLLGSGDLDGALTWVREYAPPKAAGPINRCLEQLAHIRVLLEKARRRGDAEAGMEARAILGGLIRDAEERGCRGRLLEMRILESVSLLDAAREDEALASLSEALVYAAPEGYVRVFLDEGAPVLRLLSRGLEKGAFSSAPAARWAGLLLEAAGIHPPAGRP